MKKRFGISVAGSILLDKIYEISAFPSSGELTQIRNISLAPGGLVPNVACDIKRISNAIPVSAIGRVGKDQEYQYIKNYLQNNGVCTSGIIEDENEKTSFTDVMSIPGGQRTFFTYAGASASFGFADIDLENLDSKILHLGYFLLLDKVDNGDGLKILKRAKELGIKTSIDLVSENSDRYSLIIPCLPYVDYLIINELEASSITGIESTNNNLEKTAKKLFELGVNEKVIIHKTDLSVCLSKDGFTVLPSFNIPKEYIKGTTGAGDAFCAGALIGIYEGLTDYEILDLGSCAAATSLSAADATSGIMPKEQFAQIKNSFERKKICL